MATKKPKNNSKVAVIIRMTLAIVGGILGFCIVAAFYFADAFGTHFRAGGTLGGYGASANENIDSSVQMTHSQQFYLILAFMTAILGSTLVYLLVSFIQSKLASRKAH